MKDQLKKLRETLTAQGYAWVRVEPGLTDGSINVSLELQDPRSDPFEPIKAALGKCGLVCASLALFPAVPRSAVVIRSIEIDAGAARR